MRCAVHIVENIIYASLQSVAGLIALAEVVTGAQSPDLIALAVAIALVVALAAHASVDASTQSVVV